VYGGSSTLIYARTSSQTSTNVEFPPSSGPQNVTINNGGGVTLHADRTVDGTFALTSGNLTTNANTLTLGSGAVVTGGTSSSYVIGNLKRTFAATGSKTFAVGTANGFSPFTANVTAGTFLADITVSAVQSAQPNMPAGTSILRYWPLTATNVTSANLTFEYLNGDVQGNESIYKVYRVSGGIPFAFPGSNV